MAPGVPEALVAGMIQMPCAAGELESETLEANAAL